MGQRLHLGEEEGVYCGGGSVSREADVRGQTCGAQRGPPTVETSCLKKVGTGRRNRGSLDDGPPSTRLSGYTG